MFSLFNYGMPVSRKSLWSYQGLSLGCYTGSLCWIVASSGLLEEGEENMSLWKKWNLLFNCLCYWCFCTVLLVGFVRSELFTGCRSCEEEEVFFTASWPQADWGQGIVSSPCCEQWAGVDDTFHVQLLPMTAPPYAADAFSPCVVPSWNQWCCTWGSTYFTEPREEQQWLEGGVEVHPCSEPDLCCRAEYVHAAGFKERVRRGMCICCDSASTCLLQCCLVAFQYFCGNETLPFMVMKHSDEAMKIKTWGTEVLKVMLHSEMWFVEKMAQWA